MTEPVEGVSSSRETGEKRGAGKELKREGHHHGSKVLEKDEIEISEEARERAAGRHRRSILEYLEEENAGS